MTCYIMISRRRVWSTILTIPTYFQFFVNFLQHKIHDDGENSIIDKNVLSHRMSQMNLVWHVTQSKKNKEKNI